MEESRHNKARQAVPDALPLRWRWRSVANGGTRTETDSWLKNGVLADGTVFHVPVAARRNVRGFWAVNMTKLLI